MKYILQQKGSTLVEVLVIIVIIGILVAIVTPSLSRFRGAQALRNTTDDIVSLLNKARTDTLSSYNSSQYSVHIESTRAVYFVGTTFTDGLSTNQQVTFDSSVTIPASGGINLNGGGSNISFTRLTGDTTAYGTIVIQLASDATTSKTVTISQTGLVSTN